ncbi:MAG: hypothetical protein IKE45_10515 [Halomonas sp.]|nr:hypothetical protein [Halomonas sp.]MBR2514432.1 hypothetical protein [Halomonas sp.]
MTLSIWNFVDIFTSEEASLIYCGADPDDFEMRRNYPDDHFEKQGKMHRLIVIAAQKGELKPCGVEVAKRNAKGEVDRDLASGMFGWNMLSDEDDSWKIYPIDLVRFYVERQELYRWLLTRVSRSKIPEALHIQPIPVESESLAKAEEVSDQKGLLKRTRQGNAILATLCEMGVEPTQLPYREPGKDGFRADVKKQLLSRKDLFTKKSFENIWQKLRDEGLIQEK